MLVPLLPLSRSRCLLFCLLIGLFELLAYTASDLVMPGMLGVVQELQADVSHVPFALTCYLIGGVLLQWLIGPWSDDIGRRPMMLAAAVLFAASSFLLAQVHHIELFNALRVLQGCCLGFIVAVAYPALQETFDQAGALRVTALLANIGLLSPLLAPLAGALLLNWVSWRSLFMAQAIVALLIAAGMFFFMPETVGVTRRDGSIVQRRPFNAANVGRSYLRALRDCHFLACCAAIGLIAVPLISWIALSPVLIMHSLGMDIFAYGGMQLPIFGALIAGNLWLSRLADQRTLTQLIQAGRPLLAIGAAVMMVAVVPYPAQSLMGLPLSLVVLVTGLSLYAFGIGIANTTLYRMALFAPDIGTGAAAAMLGTITVLLFSCGAALFAFVRAGDAPGTFGTAAAVAAVCALMTLRLVLTQANAQSPASAASIGSEEKR